MRSPAMTIIRKTCLAIGVAVFVAACVNPAIASKKKGTTSLWKVSSESTTIYLLGSIHLLKEEDYPLSEKMLAAYADADELVFEVHPDSLEAPELQGYVLQNAMYEEGKTLMSELGEADYDEAKALSDELDLNIGMYSTFKPWFVSIAIAMAEMQKLGFDPTQGVEMYFAGLARTDEKPMSGLETARYQMGLFVGLSDELQKDMLMYTLRQMSDIENELDAIVSAWKTGDLEGLERTLNKSLDEFPEIHKRLVTARNINWVEQIERFMDEGKTRVIIVGVGHMPGDKGLIALLEKQGYQVDPQ
jgi:uncharacterized protein YbaP (TraB family)